MAHYEDSPRGGPPPIDDDLPPERREVAGRLFDIFKRAVSAGAGVIFAPQDAEGKDPKRGGALELPKEVIQYLFGAAENLQEAILKIIGHELRKFLEHVDLGGEIQKILTSTSFEIKTEIRFIPNDQAIGSVSPSVKAKVRARRQKGDKETVVEEDIE
jgi:hypothetical protein